MVEGVKVMVEGVKVMVEGVKVMVEGVKVMVEGVKVMVEGMRVPQIVGLKVTELIVLKQMMLTPGPGASSMLSHAERKSHLPVEMEVCGVCGDVWCVWRCVVCGVCGDVWCV